ncbi:MAG: benenodin family lasso peptide [Rhodanobacter sp.]
MNTNENIRNDMQEDVIVLGVASIETKGGAGPSEAGGTGFPVIPGISEE